MRHAHVTDDIRERLLRLEHLPGGFRSCWDHPNELLSVPALTVASHSLLHAPAGDPGKPGRSPPI
jgi:hypothetical protein